MCTSIESLSDTWMDTVDWRIVHDLIEETDLGGVDVWRESFPIHPLVRSLMMMRSLRREIHSMIKRRRKKTSMKSRMRVIDHLLWWWQFVDRQYWRLEQTGFQIDNHTVFEEGERHPFQIVLERDRQISQKVSQVVRKEGTFWIPCGTSNQNKWPVHH